MLTRLSCLYTAMPVPPCALLRPEAQDGGTRAAACSAEQPEHPPTQGCNRPLMVTLNDCKAWVDSINAGAKPTQRISEAIAILQAPKSRKRRSDLQAICKIWEVTQYTRNTAQKKRSLPEIEAELVEAVVRDTNRIRNLHARHGHVSCVAAALRTSASSAEQPAAEIQEKQVSPEIADAAPGQALNILGTCNRHGITSAEQPEQLILSSGQR